MLSVYAGNDTGIYVEAVQILDLSTGLSAPATASATAVFSLETTGGTALVGPITMSFVVGSTGDFVGLLPAAATSALRGTYRSAWHGAERCESCTGNGSFRWRSLPAISVKGRMWPHASHGMIPMGGPCRRWPRPHGQEDTGRAATRIASSESGYCAACRRRWRNIIRICCGGRCMAEVTLTFKIMRGVIQDDAVPGHRAQVPRRRRCNCVARGVGPISCRRKG